MDALPSPSRSRKLGESRSLVRKSVEIYESSKKLKAFQPYLSHKLDGSHATNSVFRPFEDVLLVGRHWASIRS